MATNYKILGQTVGTASLQDLYTVPSATETVISTISVANRGTASGTYRLAIRPDGETIANKHYLAYDAPLQANDSIALTLGVSLNANDVVSVYSSTTDLTFQAFGAEIS
jgi:hypothetical protein